MLNPYCARKPFTGSNRKARYAGTRLTIRATRASVAATAASVSGSDALTPSLTFMNARTLEQQIALTVDQVRAVASLAGLFGGVSLLLVAIGLYGVTTDSVAHRTTRSGSGWRSARTGARC